jgi:RES domain-containing protein
VPGGTLWRIARRPYALDRSGTGARDSGGRWNLPGTPVIYTGRSVAIAALERFVHTAGIIPADLVLVRIDVPENASHERPPVAELPPDWDAIPPGQASMQYGTRWVQEARSLVLYVPSMLVPEETNGLLNPNHPEFAGVSMVIERAFRYDPRLMPRRARRHRSHTGSRTSSALHRQG